MTGRSVLVRTTTGALAGTLSAYDALTVTLIGPGGSVVVVQRADMVELSLSGAGGMAAGPMYAQPPPGRGLIVGGGILTGLGAANAIINASQAPRSCSHGPPG